MRGRPKGSRNKATPEERFRKGFSQGNPDDCWEWQKAANDVGYGQLWVDDRLQYVHRYSYSVHNDAHLSPDDVILHTCDNPPCVNPNHLVKGTHLENQRDKMRKGRDRKVRGVDHPYAKLTEQQVLEIDELIRKEQMSLRAIARHYDMSVNTVIAIKKGVTWTHVTGRTKIDRKDAYG